MRLCARLLLNLRELHPGRPQDEAHLWNFLEPGMFESIAIATLETCSPAADDHEQLDAPSNAIKLGHDIRRLCYIKIGLSIKNRQENVKEMDHDRKMAEDLLKLLEVFRGTEVTKLARVTLEERRFNKGTSLPTAGDIEKFNNSLYIKIEKFRSLPTYTAIGQTTMCKLIVYNRRRPGEIENSL